LLSLPEQTEEPEIISRLEHIRQFTTPKVFGQYHLYRAQGVPMRNMGTRRMSGVQSKKNPKRLASGLNPHQTRRWRRQQLDCFRFIAEQQPTNKL
jgi:hypothetical protein